MERVNLARGAFALFGAVLLMAGIHAAAVRGLADAHYTHARLVLSEGKPGNLAPRPETLSPEQASLREALAF